jgi:heme-degrading monooxygenase HmoA
MTHTSPDLTPVKPGATASPPCQPPYYAVIFCSQRRDARPDDGYAQMAQRMGELAECQPGYLGVESSRDAQGLGITVSYWRSLEDIRAWRSQSEHVAAREQGRRDWYRLYQLRIARVERQYAWDEALGLDDPGLGGGQP